MAFDGKIDDVLKQYEPLVRSKSYAVYSKLSKQCTIELEDLYQAGRLGIIEAYNTFEAGRNVPFSAYAAIRISYALYAEITANIQYGRRAIKILQDLQEDRRKAEIVYGRAVTDGELADFVGENDVEFNARVTKQQKSIPNVVSLCDLVEESCEDSFDAGAIPTEEIVHKYELKEIVSRYRVYLTHIERRVITESYFRNFSLEKIGLTLGVSKQRVFIVRDRALRKIRRCLLRDGFTGDMDV